MKVREKFEVYCYAVHSKTNGICHRGHRDFYDPTVGVRCFRVYAFITEINKPKPDGKMPSGFLLCKGGCVVKVIFLDIDGVLNDDSTPTRTKSRLIFIDWEKLLRLKQIVDATGAEIVLSSTWRYDRDNPAYNVDFLELQDAFRQVGLEFYSFTPEDVYRIRRGMEIRAWLEMHPEVDRYIILDDELFDFEQRGLLPRLIKTEFGDGGLTETHVQEAIEMLSDDSDN